MAQPPVSTSTSSSYDAGTAPASPPPPKVGVWEDFIDIFYAPSAVFARREKGSVWVPTLVLTLLLGGFYLLNAGMLEPMMDAEFRRAMAGAGGAEARANGEAIAAAQGFAATMAKVGAFIGVPIIVLIVGSVLWLVGKLVGAKQTYHAALVVAAYSYVPRVLEAFLTSVQGLLMDTASIDGRYRLSLGVGRFLDPDTASPLLLGLVGRIDVFTIWVTVLLAIGLAVTGRIPRIQAAVAALIVWLVGALPAVLPALRG